MSEITIWHNPRCSKSRQTLAILKEAGFTPTIRKYLEDAPTADEIRAALEALGISSYQLVRKGEHMFKELALENASDDELVIAMAANPILIERPVVFYKGKAALGRPPEAVKSILYGSAEASSAG